MTSPVVFAIIVNYNGWQDTVECLESLLRSDYPALRVVVVDNASRDGSVDRLRVWCDSHTSDQELRSEIVALETNQGFAAGNNIGMRHVIASGANAYAWLVNNDAVVDPTTLSRMMALAESDESIGAVGATILQYFDRDRLETAAGGTFSEWHGMGGPIRAGSHRSAPRPPVGRLDYVSGACLLISARVLERAGPMDERYFLYGEDVEWGARIRDAGYRLAYCADAEVWHKGTASTVRGSELHDYYNVKSPLLLVQKRKPLRLGAALAYSFGRCVVPKIARGEWQRLRPVGRAYRDFFRQLVRRGDKPNRSDRLSTSNVLSSP